MLFLLGIALDCDHYVFLTSRVEEEFDGVNILNTERLEPGLKRVEAPPPPPTAKQVLEEPAQRQRATGNEAQRRQEAGNVNHFRAALVVVGRDGIAAPAAMATRRGFFTVGDRGRQGSLTAAAAHEAKLRGHGRQDALTPAKPLVG